jgi:hypothetical protein
LENKKPLFSNRMMKIKAKETVFSILPHFVLRQTKQKYSLSLGQQIEPLSIDTTSLHVLGQANLAIEQ